MGYNQFQLKTEDNITLNGIILTPQSPSKGNIVFTPGFYSKIEDVIDFIEVFGNSYRAITYNLRGSGSRKYEDVQRSGGTLTIQNGASDLGQICKEICKDSVILMGHSLGGGLSLVAGRYITPDAIILLNPFMGARYLPDTMQAGIKLATALEREIQVRKHVQKLTEKLDNLLPNMNLKDLIHTSAALKDMPDPENNAEIHIQYFLSDNDSVLGTQYNEKQFTIYNAILANLSHHTENGNDVVKGLNHWLNHTGRKKFCSDNKIRDRLANRILGYLENNPIQ